LLAPRWVKRQKRYRWIGANLAPFVRSSIRVNLDRALLPIRRPQDDQPSLRTPVGIYRAQVHMAEAGVRIRACKFEIDPSGFIELG
jgi:hypothetical protein